MGVVRVALVLLVVWVAAGCGPGPAVEAEPVADRYDGPLHVASGRAGAAGQVVECATRTAGGREEEPYVGESGTTPHAALEDLFMAELLSWPLDAFHVERSDADRVLYTVRAGGHPRMAAVVHLGRTSEGRRWFIESWARCDFAELPAALTDAVDVLVWSDGDGDRVPTQEVVSYPGPQHCDWQSMTFLKTGGHTYVRASTPDLRDFFAEPYDPARPLPADAVDTGFERDGRHLWLSPDRQRAYVGDRTSVELWPATTQHLGCA
jgi:hypothetical protein